MHSHIIIGTSPLATAEAVFLKTEGKKVINIDNRKTLGGAWGIVKYDNMPEVEIGTHMWSHNPQAYEFIEKFFQCELVVLESQPKFVYKKVFVPFDIKVNVETSKALIHNALTLNFSFFKNLRKTPEIRFSILPAKYKYPKNGAKGLFDGVKRIIKEKNLEVLLSTNIATVKIDKEGGEVIFDNGESMRFSDEIVLTSQSGIQEFRFEDGSTVKREYNERLHVHWHLVIQGTIENPFSYLSVKDDDVIQRISDATVQVEDELEPDQTLVCVGICPEAYKSMSEQEQEDHIMARLWDLNLISKDSRIICSNLNTFKTYSSYREGYADVLERAKGKIRFLQSTDFTYSFYNNLDRYQRLKDGNRSQRPKV